MYLAPLKETRSLRYTETLMPYLPAARYKPQRHKNPCHVRRGLLLEAEALLLRRSPLPCWAVTPALHVVSCGRATQPYPASPDEGLAAEGGVASA